MKSFSFSKFLPALCALLACPVLVHAQATRTWVSGVGDDANPASRTAPCQTLAGAIVKTATGGVIDALDVGDFGPVTITKSISLDAPGVEVKVTTAAGNAITVNAGTSGIVVLRRLNLNGFGTATAGVSIVSAGTVILEDCTIRGFATGISLTTGAAAKVIIKTTTISNCGTAAITLAPTVNATVSIANSHISDSGAGVTANAKTTLDVTDTVCSGTAAAGFNALATGAVINLTRCTVFDNVTGIQSSGAITLNDCAIINNSGAGLSYAKGAQINTFGNNEVSGNTPDGLPSTFPVAKK
jgi:hypothetical protein